MALGAQWRYHCRDFRIGTVLHKASDESKEFPAMRETASVQCHSEAEAVGFRESQHRASYPLFHAALHGGTALFSRKKQLQWPIVSILNKAKKRLKECVQHLHKQPLEYSKLSHS